jgi:hypothetical protein
VALPHEEEHCGRSPVAAVGRMSFVDGVLRRRRGRKEGERRWRWCGLPMGVIMALYVIFC